jgi:hypothetical protein
MTPLAFSFYKVRLPIEETSIEFPFKLVAVGELNPFARVLASRQSGRVWRKGSSMLMISKAENYRRYAGECLRLAQIISNRTEKTILLQMAETWRRLASEIERHTPSTDGER